MCSDTQCLHVFVCCVVCCKQATDERTTDGQEGRKRLEEERGGEENPYPLDYSVYGIWTVVWLRRACECVKSVCMCVRSASGTHLECSYSVFQLSQPLAHFTSLCFPWLPFFPPQGKSQSLFKSRGAECIKRIIKCTPVFFFSQSNRRKDCGDGSIVMLTLAKIRRNILAFSETSVFTFSLRVRWEDWHHTHICPLNMKHKEPGSHKST